MKNARACIQVHGGMGYTWEMPAHYYLKRAWVLAGCSGRRGAQRAAGPAGRRGALSRPERLWIGRQIYYTFRIVNTPRPAARRRAEFIEGDAAWGFWMAGRRSSPAAGAASDAGTASHLAEQGASVVVNDVDLAEAQKVVDEIAAKGGKAVASSDDIGTRAGAQRAGRAVRRHVRRDPRRS